MKVIISGLTPKLRVLILLAGMAGLAQAGSMSLLQIGTKMGVMVTPTAFKTYAGTGPNWSTATWNPNGVPTDGDDIVFDGTHNQPSTMDMAGKVFSSIRVLDGYTSTITQASPVSITGSVGISMTSGKIDDDINATQGLTLGGPLTVSGSGSFVRDRGDAGSSIVFNMSGTQIISGQKISLQNTIIESGTTLSLASNTVVYQYPSSSMSLFVKGSIKGGVDSTLRIWHYANSGDFVAIDGTGNSGIQFHGLEVFGDNLGTTNTMYFRLAGINAMTVSGTLKITCNGMPTATTSLELAATRLTLGSLELAPDNNTGLVNINDASGALIFSRLSGTGTVASRTYTNLEIASAAGTTFNTSGGFSATNLTISSGTLKISNGETITLVSGSTGALHVKSGATLTFDSSGGVLFLGGSVAGDWTYTMNVDNGASAYIDKLNFWRAGSFDAATNLTLIGSVTCNVLRLSASSSSRANLYMGSSSLTLNSSSPFVLGGTLTGANILPESSLVVYVGSGATVNGMAYNNLVFAGSGTYNVNPDLTIAGDFTVGSGITAVNVTPSPAVIRLTGNATINGNLGEASTPTDYWLELGGANQTLSGSGSLNMVRLSLANSGTKVLTVPGVRLSAIGMASGTTLTLGAVDLTLFGVGTKISGAGTFSAGTSTVRLTSSGGGTVPAVMFNHLSVDGSSTWAAAGNVTCTGNFTVGVGSLDMNQNDLAVGGNLTLNAGMGGVKTLTVYGASSSVGGSANFHVGAMNFIGSGASNALVGSGVIGTLTVAVGGGSVNLGSGTLNLTGTTPFVLTSGTITPSSSVVQYSGTGSVTVLTGMAYNDLQFTGSGTYTASGPVALSGNLRATSGTFISTSTVSLLGAGKSIEAPASISLTDMDVVGTTALTGTGLSVGGNINNFSTLTMVMGARLTLSGTGTQILGGSGMTRLYDAVVAGTSGSVTLAGNAMIDNSLVINNGKTFLLGTNTLTLAGTGTPLGGSGTISAASANLIYMASSGNATIPAITVNNLAIIGGAAYSAAGGLTCSGNATVSAGSLTLNAGSVMVGSLTVTGATVTASSVLTVTGAVSMMNATLSAASANVTVGGGIGLTTGAFLVSQATVTGGVILTNASMTTSSQSSISGDLKLLNATLTASSQVTVGGDIINSNGSLTVSSPSVLSLYGTNKTIQADGLTTVGNLVIGNSAAYTLTGSQTVTVGNTLTVETSAILNLGNGTVKLTGAGIPIVNNGTIVPGTSTIEYQAPTGSTLVAIPYYSLKVSGSGSIYGPPAAITLGGDLLISSSSANLTTTSPVVLTGSGRNLTVTGGYIAESLAVSGSYTLGGTLTLAGSGAPLAVSGTLTPGTSTVVYTGTTVTLAPITYHHLTVKKLNGNFKPGGNLSVNGDLTIGDNSNLDLGSIRMTLGGGIVTGTAGILTASPSSTLVAIGTSKEFNGTNGTVSLGSVVITGSYTGAVSPSQSFLIAGNFEVALGGQFSIGTHSLVVGGDLASTGTFIQSTSGPLVLTGLSKTWSGSSNANFGAVRIMGVIALGTNVKADSVVVVGSLDKLNFTITKPSDSSATPISSPNIFVFSSENGLSEVAGMVFAVTLRAENGSGSVVTNYTGVHSITLARSSSAITFPAGLTAGSPASLTFTSGLVVLTGFRISDGSASSVRLTASDESNVAGTVAITIVQAQFVVATEHSGSEVGGVVFAVTLRVENGSGSVLTNYTGAHSITLARSSPAITFPVGLTAGSQISLTFANGLVVLTGFKITDGSASSVKLTATDESNVTGSGTITIIQGTFVFITEHAGTETADISFALTLKIQNNSGSVITDYSGMHSITLTRSSTTMGFPTGLTSGSPVSLTFTSGLVAITGFKFSDDSATPVRLTITDENGILGAGVIVVAPGKTVTSTTGGTLTSTDGTKVEIPTDAFPASVGTNIIVSVTVPTVSTLNVSSGGFEMAQVTLIAVKEISLKDPSTGLVVEAGTFLKPVAIEIPYALTSLPTGVAEGNLRIFRYDHAARRWRMAEGTQVVDTVKRVVKTSVTKFSVFALLPVSVSATFDNVKAYPSPFKPATAVDGTLKWINLPLDAEVKVYTVDGSLVRTISVATYGNAGWLTWDGKNDLGEAVTAGVYFYVVTSTSTSGKKTGKIALQR